MSERDRVFGEMLSVLKDVRRVIGMDSRASMKEQTDILRRMRLSIAAAEAVQDPTPPVAGSGAEG